MGGARRSNKEFPLFFQQQLVCRRHTGMDRQSTKNQDAPLICFDRGRNVLQDAPLICLGRGRNVLRRCRRLGFSADTSPDRSIASSCLFAFELLLGRWECRCNKDPASFLQCTLSFLLKSLFLGSTIQLYTLQSTTQVFMGDVVTSKRHKLFYKL